MKRELTGSLDAAMTRGAGLFGLAVGARLLGIYPISAIAASIGLNVTLSFYHDHVDFGFIANASAIADVLALADHTSLAYRELGAA